MEREKRGCLTVKGRKFYVYDGHNTIGRDKHATVIVKDLGVSHQQAILTIVDETRHFISDFNSSNGTHINNEKLVPFKLYEIKDGSQIVFSVDVIATYKKISKNELSDPEEIASPEYTQIDDSCFAQNTQFIDISNEFEGKILKPKYIIPGDGFNFNSIITQNLTNPNINKQGDTEVKIVRSIASSALFNDDTPHTNYPLKSSCTDEEVTSSENRVQKGTIEISSTTNVCEILKKGDSVNVAEDVSLTQIIGSCNEHTKASILIDCKPTEVSNQCKVPNLNEQIVSNLDQLTGLHIINSEKICNISNLRINDDTSDNPIKDKDKTKMSPITLSDNQKNNSNSPMVADTSALTNDQKNNSDPSIISHISALHSDQAHISKLSMVSDNSAYPDNQKHPSTVSDNSAFPDDQKHPSTVSASTDKTELLLDNENSSKFVIPEDDYDFNSVDPRQKLESTILHDPSKTLKSETDSSLNVSSSVITDAVLDQNLPLTAGASKDVQLIPKNDDNFISNKSDDSNREISDKTQTENLIPDTSIVIEDALISHDKKNTAQIVEQEETVNNSVYIIPDDGYDFKSVVIKGDDTLEISSKSDTVNNFPQLLQKSELGSDLNVVGVKGDHQDLPTQLFSNQKPTDVNDLSEDQDLPSQVSLPKIKRSVGLNQNDAEDIFNLPTQALHEKSKLASVSKLQEDDHIYDLPTQLLPKSGVVITTQLLPNSEDSNLPKLNDEILDMPQVLDITNQLNPENVIEDTRSNNSENPNDICQTQLQVLSKASNPKSCLSNESEKVVDNIHDFPTKVLVQIQKSDTEELKDIHGLPNTKSNDLEVVVDNIHDFPTKNMKDIHFLASENELQVQVNSENISEDNIPNILAQSNNVNSEEFNPSTPAHDLSKVEAASDSRSCPFNISNSENVVDLPTQVLLQSKNSDRNELKDIRGLTLLPENELQVLPKPNFANQINADDPTSISSDSNNCSSEEPKDICQQSKAHHSNITNDDIHDIPSQTNNSDLANQLNSANTIEDIHDMSTRILTEPKDFSSKESEDGEDAKSDVILEDKSRHELARVDKSDSKDICHTLTEKSNLHSEIVNDDIHKSTQELPQINTVDSGDFKPINCLPTPTISNRDIVKESNEINSEKLSQSISIEIGEQTEDISDDKLARNDVAIEKISDFASESCNKTGLENLAPINIEAKQPLVDVSDSLKINVDAMISQDNKMASSSRNKTTYFEPVEVDDTRSIENMPTQSNIIISVSESPECDNTATIDNTHAQILAEAGDTKSEASSTATNVSNTDDNVSMMFQLPTKSDCQLKTVSSQKSDSNEVVKSESGCSITNQLLEEEDDKIVSTSIERNIEVKISQDEDNALTGGDETLEDSSKVVSNLAENTIVVLSSEASQSQSFSYALEEVCNLESDSDQKSINPKTPHGEDIDTSSNSPSDKVLDTNNRSNDLEEDCINAANFKKVPQGFPQEISGTVQIDNNSGVRNINDSSITGAGDNAISSDSTLTQVAKTASTIDVEDQHVNPTFDKVNSNKKLCTGEALFNNLTHSPIETVDKGSSDATTRSSSRDESPQTIIKANSDKTALVLSESREKIALSEEGIVESNSNLTDIIPLESYAEDISVACEMVSETSTDSTVLVLRNKVNLDDNNPIGEGNSCETALVLLESHEGNTPMGEANLEKIPSDEDMIVSLETDSDRTALVIFESCDKVPLVENTPIGEANSDQTTLVSLESLEEDPFNKNIPVNLDVSLESTEEIPYDKDTKVLLETVGEAKPDGTTLVSLESRVEVPLGEADSDGNILVSFESCEEVPSDENNSVGATNSESREEIDASVLVTNVGGTVIVKFESCDKVSFDEKTSIGKANLDETALVSLESSEDVSVDEDPKTVDEAKSDETIPVSLESCVEDPLDENTPVAETNSDGNALLSLEVHSDENPLVDENNSESREEIPLDEDIIISHKINSDETKVNLDENISDGTLSLQSSEEVSLGKDTHVVGVAHVSLVLLNDDTPLSHKTVGDANSDETTLQSPKKVPSDEETIVLHTEANSDETPLVSSESRDELTLDENTPIGKNSADGIVGLVTLEKLPLNENTPIDEANSDVTPSILLESGEVEAPQVSLGEANSDVSLQFCNEIPLDKNTPIGKANAGGIALVSLVLPLNQNTSVGEAISDGNPIVLLESHEDLSPVSFGGKTNSDSMTHILLESSEKVPSVTIPHISLVVDGEANSETVKSHDEVCSDQNVNISLDPCNETSTDGATVVSLESRDVDSSEEIETVTKDDAISFVSLESCDEAPSNTLTQVSLESGSEDKLDGTTLTSLQSCSEFPPGEDSHVLLLPGGEANLDRTTLASFESNDKDVSLPSGDDNSDMIMPVSLQSCISFKSEDKGNLDTTHISLELSNESNSLQTRDEVTSKNLAKVSPGNEGNSDCTTLVSLEPLDRSPTLTHDSLEPSNKGTSDITGLTFDTSNEATHVILEPNQETNSDCTVALLEPLHGTSSDVLTHVSIQPSDDGNSDESGLIVDTSDEANSGCNTLVSIEPHVLLKCSDYGNPGETGVTSDTANEVTPVLLEPSHENNLEHTTLISLEPLDGASLDKHSHVSLELRDDGSPDETGLTLDTSNEVEENGANSDCTTPVLLEHLEGAPSEVLLECRDKGNSDETALTSDTDNEETPVIPSNLDCTTPVSLESLETPSDKLTQVLLEPRVEGSSDETRLTLDTLNEVTPVILEPSNEANSDCTTLVSLEPLDGAPSDKLILTHDSLESSDKDPSDVIDLTLDTSNEVTHVILKPSNEANSDGTIALLEPPDGASSDALTPFSLEPSEEKSFITSDSSNEVNTAVVESSYEAKLKPGHEGNSDETCLTLESRDEEVSVAPEAVETVHASSYSQNEASLHTITNVGNERTSGEINPIEVCDEVSSDTQTVALEPVDKSSAELTPHVSHQHANEDEIPLSLKSRHDEHTAVEANSVCTDLVLLESSDEVSSRENAHITLKPDDGVTSTGSHDETALDTFSHVSLEPNHEEANADENVHFSFKSCHKVHSDKKTNVSLETGDDASSNENSVMVSIKYPFDVVDHVCLQPGDNRNSLASPVNEDTSTFLERDDEAVSERAALISVDVPNKLDHVSLRLLAKAQSDESPILDSHDKNTSDKCTLGPLGLIDESNSLCTTQTSLKDRVEHSSDGTVLIMLGSHDEDSPPKGVDVPSKEANSDSTALASLASRDVTSAPIKSGDENNSDSAPFKLESHNLATVDESTHMSLEPDNEDEHLALKSPNNDFSDTSNPTTVEICDEASSRDEGNFGETTPTSRVEDSSNTHQPNSDCASLVPLQTRDESLQDKLTEVSVESGDKANVGNRVLDSLESSEKVYLDKLEASNAGNSDEVPLIRSSLESRNKGSSIEDSHVAIESGDGVNSNCDARASLQSSDADSLDQCVDVSLEPCDKGNSDVSLARVSLDPGDVSNDDRAGMIPNTSVVLEPDDKNNSDVTVHDSLKSCNEGNSDETALVSLESQHEAYSDEDTPVFNEANADCTALTSLVSRDEGPLDKLINFSLEPGDEGNSVRTIRVSFESNDEETLDEDTSVSLELGGKDDSAVLLESSNETSRDKLDQGNTDGTALNETLLDAAHEANSDGTALVPLESSDEVSSDKEEVVSNRTPTNSLESQDEPLSHNGILISSETSEEIKSKLTAIPSLETHSEASFNNPNHVSLETNSLESCDQASTDGNSLVSLEPRNEANLDKSAIDSIETYDEAPLDKTDILRKPGHRSDSDGTALVRVEASDEVVSVGSNSNVTASLSLESCNETPSNRIPHLSLESHDKTTEDKATHVLLETERNSGKSRDEPNPASFESCDKIAPVSLGHTDEAISLDLEENSDKSALVSLETSDQATLDVSLKLKCLHEARLGKITHVSVQPDETATHVSFTSTEETKSTFVCNEAPLKSCPDEVASVSLEIEPEATSGSAIFASPIESCSDDVSILLESEDSANPVLSSDEICLDKVPKKPDLSSPSKSRAVTCSDTVAYVSLETDESSNAERANLASSLETCSNRVDSVSATDAAKPNFDLLSEICSDEVASVSLETGNEANSGCENLAPSSESCDTISSVSLITGDEVNAERGNFASSPETCSDKVDSVLLKTEPNFALLPESCEAVYLDKVASVSLETSNGANSVKANIASSSESSDTIFSVSLVTADEENVEKPSSESCSNKVDSVSLETDAVKPNFALMPESCDAVCSDEVASVSLETENEANLGRANLASSSESCDTVSSISLITADEMNAEKPNLASSLETSSDEIDSVSLQTDDKNNEVKPNFDLSSESCDAICSDEVASVSLESDNEVNSRQGNLACGTISSVSPITDDEVNLATSSEICDETESEISQVTVENTETCLKNSTGLMSDINPNTTDVQISINIGNENEEKSNLEVNEETSLQNLNECNIDVQALSKLNEDSADKISISTEQKPALVSLVATDEDITVAQEFGVLATNVNVTTEIPGGLKKSKTTTKEKVDDNLKHSALSLIRNAYYDSESEDEDENMEVESTGLKQLNNVPIINSTVENSKYDAFGNLDKVGNDKTISSVSNNETIIVEKVGVKNSDSHSDADHNMTDVSQNKCLSDIDLPSCESNNLQSQNSNSNSFGNLEKDHDDEIFTSKTNINITIVDKVAICVVDGVKNSYSQSDSDYNMTNVVQNKCSLSDIDLTLHDLQSKTENLKSSLEENNDNAFSAASSITASNSNTSGNISEIQKSIETKVAKDISSSSSNDLTDPSYDGITETNLKPFSIKENKIFEISQANNEDNSKTSFVGNNTVTLQNQSCTAELLKGRNTSISKVDDISLVPSINTEVNETSVKSVGKIVIESAQELQDPKVKSPCPTEAGGSTVSEKISASDLNDTNINSTLQNTQTDDNFYTASTQLFNDTGFCTNISNDISPANKNNTIFAIPDDGFDFNTVNTQNLRNIPSTKSKPVPDIHDLPTQLDTRKNTTGIRNLKDLQKIPSTSSKTVPDLHDLPTQLIPSKNKSAQIDLHDMPTQIIETESTSENSSENTQINPLNIHDMATQLIVPAEDFKNDQQVEEVELIVDNNVSIYEAETQLNADEGSAANVLAINKNNSLSVTQEDDDATQEYHVESTADNLQIDEKSNESDTQIIEIAEPTSAIPDNVANISLSKNLLETSTDSDEFLASNAETILTTLADTDPQSQLPMHLLKKRTSNRLTSNDIESTTSSDSNKGFHIEQVESPKEDSNPTELKRKRQNDDDTQIDENSNDSVNFLAAAHSTLATPNDSDPQSQLPMHLLKKRSPSNRLNSNDIECGEESNQSKTTVVEDKNVNSDADTDVDAAKSTVNNESDSHIDIEVAESPEKCEDSDSSEKFQEDSDPQSQLQVNRLKNKSRSRVIEDRGSSSSDFEEDAKRSKRKKTVKTRKKRDDGNTTTPRTYSRKKSVIKNSDSDTDVENTLKDPDKIIAGETDTDVDTSVNQNVTTSVVDSTDVEDSFVKRRSFMDVSNEVIPATQEMANTSRVSFTKGLSTIVDVTGDECNKDNTCSESSFRLGLTQDEEEMRNNDIYVVQGLEESSDDSFDCEGPTQKIDAPGPSNLNKDDDDFDFTGPTQKFNKDDSEKDDIFDTSNQKVDDEVFKRPLQRRSILKTSLRLENSEKSANADLDDSDLFIAATQVMDPDDKRRGSTQEAEENLDDSEVFIAPTQKVVIEITSSRTNVENINDSDIFCAATQKMDGSKDQDESFGSNISERMDDTLFSAATQKMDFVQPASTIKSKNVDEDEESDSIFFAATQVSETNEEAPVARNISTQDTVTVADSNSFDLGDDERVLNESTDDKFQEKKKKVSFGKVHDIENDIVNKNSDIESVPEDVESQMEIMFATQSVHLTEPDATRPSNPVEKTLQECTTQDVMDTLTTEEKVSKAAPRRSRRNSKELAEFSEPVKKRRTRKQSTDQKEVEVSNNISSALKTVPEGIATVVTPRKSKLSTIRTGLDDEKEDDSNIDTFESDFNVESTPLVKDNIEAHCSTSLVAGITNPKVQVAELPNPKVEVAEVSTPKVKVAELPNPKLDVAEVSNPKVEVAEVSNPKVEVTVVENRRPIREGRKKMYETLDEEYFSMPIKKRQMRSDKMYDPYTRFEDLYAEKPAARKRTSRKKEDTGETKSTRGRATRGSRKTNNAETSVESKAQQSLMSGDDAESSVPSKEKSLRKTKGAEKVSRKRKSSDSDDQCLITISVPKKQKNITIIDDSGDDKSYLQPDTSAKRSVKPEIHTMSLLSTPERGKRKLKSKVVFTMFDSPELSSLVRSLGGVMVDSIDAATVLVTKNVLRSQKLLCAIGQCKPICTPDWLQECKKANTFLDPWDFLIEDKDAEKNWNFSMKESFNRSKCRKLFEGYSFHVLATKALDVIKAAIESCGGRCVSKTPKTGNFVVVAAEENRGKCTRYFKQNVKVVLPEAIFDGVLRQDIVFEKHLLT